MHFEKLEMKDNLILNKTADDPSMSDADDLNSFFVEDVAKAEPVSSNEETEKPDIVD